MRHNLGLAGLATFLLCLTACSGVGSADRERVTLTLGAYTVPKEVYQQELIPRFQRLWKKQTGQNVYFKQSYMASGAQSRAIAMGFEADVACLSLDADMERLRDAGLIAHERTGGEGSPGVVTRSVVVIMARPGNPKRIRDWKDLVRRDLDVLYPSPKTSGGAMWVINALYGSWLKRTEVAGGRADPAGARRFLAAVQSRVKIMDKSGRASVTTFENGVGDVLLTYENEAILRRRQGKQFHVIIPEFTMLIENPLALVDAYVTRHGNRRVAEAFVRFLYSKEAQRCFARYGFRPVNPAVAAEFSGEFPEPRHLFDIRYLGGWERAMDLLYGSNGVWTGIVEQAYGGE